MSHLCRHLQPHSVWRLDHCHGICFFPCFTPGWMASLSAPASSQHGSSVDLTTPQSAAMCTVSYGPCWTPGSSVNFQIHYTSFSWHLYPKQLTISAFNHECRLSDINWELVPPFWSQDSKQGCICFLSSNIVLTHVQYVQYVWRTKTDMTPYFGLNSAFVE